MNQTESLNTIAQDIREIKDLLLKVTDPNKNDRLKQ